MAEAYSSWSTNYADYRMRGYVNAYVSRSNATSVWITVEGHAYFDAACQYGIAGQVGHAAAGGVGAQWSGDINWACLSTHTSGAYGKVTYGPFPRKSKAYNVYCWYKTWGKAVNGYGGWRWGGTEAGVNVSVPAIAYYKPRPPKNPTVTRVSDESQKIEWAGDYTGMDGQYPWTGVHIDRREDDGGWVTIKDVSWSVTNYADNSTKPGHKYSYGLRSYGPGGTSDRTAEKTVFTTPSSLGSLEASKADAGKVVLTGRDAPAYVDSWEFQRTSDGGSTWNGVSLTAAWEDTSPPAGAVRYRARAVKSGLNGPWCESNTLTTICPPLSPNIADLRPAYAFDGTSALISLTVVPNHPDCTSVTSVEVEFTSPDGVSSVVALSGSQTAVTRPVSSKGEYTVRARTKGIDPSWGEWSRYYVFNVADAPQAYFTNPAIDGDLIGSVPFDVSWVAVDETGISHTSVSLIDGDGNIVERSEPDAGVNKWSVGAYSAIRNGQTYTLVLEVSGGSGLTVTSTREFTTHWLEPAVPRVTITYDSELAANILVEQGITDFTVHGTTLEGPLFKGGANVSIGGNTAVEVPTAVLHAPVEAVSYDVSCIRSDGSLAAIARGIRPGETAFDRLPPLNCECRYVITAYAATGTSSTLTVPSTCRSKFAAFNFGYDAGVFLRGGFDPTSKHSAGHEREFYHFADGGANNGMPMRYDLGDTDISMSASWRLYDMADANRVRDISRQWSWCWYRDLDGNRATVSVDFEIERESSGMRKWSITADMTEGVWEEPINGYV